MLLPGAGTMMYWGATIGIPVTMKGIAYLYTALGGAATFAGMKAFDKRNERLGAETIVKDGKRVKLEDVRMQKIKVEAKNFDPGHEEEKIKVNKEFDKVEMERKNAAIEAYELANSEAESVAFKGVKPPKPNALLLGYTQDAQPYWGYFTNFIVAGSTGSRKSRKLHAMLLNFLGSKQGTVYIGDFKQIDFKAFKEKKGVAMYIDDVKNTKQLIDAFKAEYQRRLDLIKAGYTNEETGEFKEYIDIEDYNVKNPKKKQKPYLLIIDEYADLSDCYQDRNKKPIGPYQDLIELARKIRATGGRIILGTQRPSADVVIGTLKNNTQIIGMRCLNETNSKIMVDTGGCEKLSPGEALTIDDNKLIKVWNYDLDNDHLESCIDKLK